MESFVWNDRYLTGEDQIDQEHQELVRIINLVASLQSQGENEAEVAEKTRPIFDDLVRYAVNHFRHEEALMGKMGCDARHVSLHHSIHQDFAKQVVAMRSGKVGEADSPWLLSFLTNWLAYHILGMDQSMARQVRNIRKGMSAAEAYETEQARPRDPATASLLDALNSMYRVVVSRNQSLSEVNEELEQVLKERFRTLAAQQQMELLLGQIIEGDPVPTFVIDAEHRVTHWNRACATVTGTPGDKVLGTNRPWSAFYDSERPVLADLIVSGELGGLDAHYNGKFRRSSLIDDAFEVEDFFPHFGQNGRWLYFTAAPLRDAQGVIIGAIETLQDTTERHLAEEGLRRYQGELEQLVARRTSQLASANRQMAGELARREKAEMALLDRYRELTALNIQLEQTREQLLQSEKLASIGQLAAGVAHEINNPIGYVHSNVGALESYIDQLMQLLTAYQGAEADLPAAKREEVVAVRESIDLDFLREDIPNLMRESREGISRVKKIVQDLKDFSRVDTKCEWQMANLHQGIDSTLNIVANEVKYKADVVKDYGDLPNIECLPSQLNQVFMNLLVNAAQAIDSNKRGTLTIRTRCDGDTVRLAFSDDGGGIPEAIRQKIFDPFFTTKPVGKGTGLGLSLSYSIIQDHHGRIELDSEEGVGTTFTLVLPVNQPARENRGK